MAKKNKDINNNAWVIVSVVAVSVLLFFVSSYSGLLGTKTFTGNDNEIKTALECTRAADNSLQAKLTVNDTVVNEEALPDGSALAYQTISFNVADGSGVVSPAAGTTDEAGMVLGTYEGSAAAPVITASFAGDKTRVDIDGVERIVVAYGPASTQCK